MQKPFVRLAFCCIAGYSAARSRREVEDSVESVTLDCDDEVGQEQAVGSNGLVYGLYTFGAPGSASPGVQNTRTSSPCFPGLRTWHTKQGYTDIVAYITNPVKYWHARGKAMDIMVANLGTDKNFSCSESTTFLPNSGTASVDLHHPRLYAQTGDIKFDRSLSDIVYFATRASYMNTNDVKKDAESRGWKLAGSAFHDGSGSIIGGPQASHLIQDPSNLCVITFMGTQDRADWLSNLAISAVPFCGLTLQGETCSGFSTCNTGKSRGSFAHWGFKDKLKTIVQTSQWQNNIKAKLSKCSRVKVVGHSAGGAMAELYTACVANAPSRGSFGYDDEYKYMGWTTGTPGQIA